MQLLRKTLASLYRKKGMMPLKRSDLVFFASMDIRWFTPQQSRRIVRFSLEKGLLVADDEDRLVLGFDCTDIKPDLEFKPNVPSLMAEIEGSDTANSDAEHSEEKAATTTDPQEQDDPERDPENSAAQNADDEIPKERSVPETLSAAEKDTTPKRQPVPEVSPSPRERTVSKKVDQGAADKRLLFKETIDRIEAETDLKKRDIIAQCNEVKKRFGAIDMAAAALVVARKYAIPMDDLLEKAEEALL